MKHIIGKLLRFIDNQHIKKVDKFLRKYNDDKSIEYLIKKMAYDLPLDIYNQIVNKSIGYALNYDDNVEYYEMTYKFKQIIKYKVKLILEKINIIL